MREARAIDQRTLTEVLTENRFERLRAGLPDQPLDLIPAEVFSIPSTVGESSAASTIHSHRQLKSIADQAYQELHHIWN